MWLRDGEYSALVSHQGGSVLQYQYRGHFILGPARMVEIAGELKPRGVTHWCLPQFGPDQRPGVVDRQPQHGFLREMPLHLHASGEAFAKFKGKACVDPYDHDKHLQIKTEAEVLGSALNLSLSVWNQMEVAYPVLPALHPYFAVPVNGATLSLGSEEISHREVPGKARIISKPEGKLGVLLHGVGFVEIRCSPTPTNVAVWSDNPKQYVCIEPLFAPDGSYGKATLEGLSLKPGEMQKWVVNLHFKPAL